MLAFTALTVRIQLITVDPARERDVGTKTVEIMASEVVAHTEETRQIPDELVMSQKVMHVHMCHADFTQQFDQLWLVVVQIKDRAPRP